MSLSKTSQNKINNFYTGLNNTKSITQFCNKTNIVCHFLYGILYSVCNNNKFYTAKVLYFLQTCESTFDTKLRNKNLSAHVLMNNDFWLKMLALKVYLQIWATGWNQSVKMNMFRMKEQLVFMHACNCNGFTLSYACRRRPHITADVHK